MAAVQAEPGDERVDLLTSVFADADNAAWQALDRHAAVGALARYASLTNPERMELFGAATAAIWLGR